MNPTEAATQFSQLSKQNREEKLVSTVRQQFPFIRKLSTESNAGVYIMYATVSYLPEKIPVGLISGAALKFLTIWLAIASLPNGVVLLDEIENGLHHTRMPSMWSTILDFSREYRTQVIAATHSKECLDALATVMKKNAGELCVLHVKREDGQSKVVRFNGDDALCAIEQGFDVR
jgi:AAA15 family ATPase/GTPase